MSLNIMKYILSVFLLLVIISCYEKDSLRGSGLLSKKIVPESGMKFGEESYADRQDESSSKVLIPHAALEDDEIILRIINQNLNIDRIVEQILIYKKKNDSNSHIRIAVLDYDYVRKSYKIAWKGETIATNVWTFDISFIDIVGDHKIEIVCRGTDDSGKDVLNIFRRTSAPEGSIGLYYFSICEISSEGRIEVSRLERSPGYKLNQDQGTSFPIITYEPDPDSDNIMDLIMSEYYYIHSMRMYVKAKAEKIPGKRIEENQLYKLLQKDKKAFEKFLSGSWYKSSNSTSNTESIILLKPDNKKFIFFSGNIMEIHNWSTSEKRKPNILNIKGRNESNPSIEKQVSIYILGIDSLRILVRNSEFNTGTSQWDGDYSRLSRDLQTHYSDRKSEKKRLTELFGEYRGNNLKFYFTPPFFTIDENGKKRKGGFAIYNAGVDIIQLRFFDKNKDIVENKYYKITLKQIDKKDKIIRSIKLSPGYVNVYGFQKYERPDLIIEQTEIINDKF